LKSLNKFLGALAALPLLIVLGSCDTATGGSEPKSADSSLPPAAAVGTWVGTLEIEMTTSSVTAEIGADGTIQLVIVQDLSEMVASNLSTIATNLTEDQYWAAIQNPESEYYMGEASDSVSLAFSDSAPYILTITRATTWADFAGLDTATYSFSDGDQTLTVTVTENVLDAEGKVQMSGEDPTVPLTTTTTFNLNAKIYPPEKAVGIWLGDPSSFGSAVQGIQATIDGSDSIQIVMVWDVSEMLVSAASNADCTVEEMWGYYQDPASPHYFGTLFGTPSFASDASEGTYSVTTTGTDTWNRFVNNSNGNVSFSNDGTTMTIITTVWSKMPAV